MNLVHQFRERLWLGPASLAFLSGLLLKWQFPVKAAAEMLTTPVSLFRTRIFSPTVSFVRR